MFTAALFTILKTWKQPKCPLTEEWIKKMWYIYTMEYHSAIKMNEIMPRAATRMDIEITKLKEVNQKEKDKYMISLIVESNFKNDINELIYKTEIDSDFKNKLMVTKGEALGGEG